MLKKINISNKKASYNYFIIETIEAGIILLGSEVKSIKLGSISLKEGFVKILKNKKEIFLYNVYIGKYKDNNIFEKIDLLRPRKLLLHKRQIVKLLFKIKQLNVTIIPLKMYLKNNFIKVLIGLCKGKKKYDKREVLKKRTIERNLNKKIYLF